MNNIKWVLTVPPLWDEKGKNFMKEIAQDIDMIHIDIALEPEAASLALLHDKKLKEKFKQKGKVFLIVDAGGYTVDITANKILDDKNYNLEQLIKPTSVACGSNLINEKIIEIIEKIYGKSTIDNAKKNDYEAWEITLDEIEKKKKEVNDNEAENYKIPIAFKNSIWCITKSSCEESYNGTKISYSSTEINIPSQIIINIISEIASNLANLIRKNMPNLTIDFIALTGGFSENKILQKILKNEFKGNQILFLDSPLETVMKGAALF